MGKVPEDIFINKLMEETYKFVPESETCKNSNELLDYFNSKDKKNEDDDLLRFFKDNSIDHYKCRYIEKIFCFRLELGELILDIPKNWIFFETMYSLFSSERGDIFRVCHDQDSGGFFKVVSSFSKYKSDIVFVVNSDKKIHMVFLPENDIQKLNWLKNYSTGCVLQNAA